MRSRNAITAQPWHPTHHHAITAARSTGTGTAITTTVTAAPADFNRAFAIGVVLNTGFVVVEAPTASSPTLLALLADAGHNLQRRAGPVARPGRRRRW